MGGGIAMRAAAKVAGLGVFNTGLRGTDNTVVSAARQASRSVASVVSSSSDDLKLAIANDNSNVNSSVEIAYDDWDFAGVEDELFREVAEPMPRVVFGGAPTIQEAQQATHDLNDALEKTYLSPNGINGQIANVETKNCLVSETSVSKHAIQAFKFLHESPSARNVVASIASDPNVWNAVLENKEFVDFLETHKTSVVFTDMDQNVKDSSVESSQESESESKPESKSGKGFMDYVEDIKERITVTVVEMMNTLSDTFQSLFGGSSKGEVVANPDGTAGISVEKAATGALFGLAVMVIMVVVFKRV